MSEVLAKIVRGRPKGELRQAITALAATLTQAKGVKDAVWHIADATTPKGKPDTATYSVPKGAIVVPFELTKGKSSPNVGEQVRSGMADAGNETAFKVESVGIKTDAGELASVYYVSAE